MSATVETHTNGKAESETLKSATETTDNGVATNGAPKASGKVPEWLKAELFVELLQKNIPNFKCIKNFSAKASQDAGDNYATLMASVNIDAELEDGKSQPISYMIKLPIDTLQNVLNNNNIFDTESTMYKDVIPEMEKLYSDAGVEVKFSPQYYDIETPSECGVILMEDLRPRNFKNANRLEGFDMEHTKCALKKLAQWHAASAVRVEVKGEYPQKVCVGLFTEDFLKMMEQLGKSMTPLYLECVRVYEGHEEYYDSLKRNRENFVQEFAPLLKADPNEFNVLNHGDFWANNIMFQHDDAGKVKETYFVDFQCVRYGSPVNDLYTVLLSSTSLDVKLKYFDYFVKYYHDNLIECLKLLKYPKKLPTLKEIHIALLKYGTLAVSTAAGHMSIVLLEPTEGAELSNLMGTSEESIAFRKHMYTNARYRKHIEVVYPWLYHRGAF
uniref:Hemoglobin subunit alpha-2 n=1 Tax=Zeugodacus cucurbitae TaxID=28588 RepID=A0A0A1XJK5_ZEUCU